MRSSDVFYEWQKNSDNFQPVVRIRAFPETKMTFGSAFAAAFTGRWNLGALGLGSAYAALFWLAMLAVLHVRVRPLYRWWRS